MERLVILICVCFVTTTAQNTLYQGPGSQHFNPDFIAALQHQARPVAARSRHYNAVSNSLHQDLKIHQLQLQQHEQEVQRHLQQENEAIRGNFQPTNQQVYQQQALTAAHQPQDQQEYYLEQQQALKDAHQPQELDTPKNYHPPALVHKVNIGPKLQGDYDFVYDTGKGPFGQSFRTETRLPDGTVKGSYGYIDSDGRQRTVNYIAGKGGFVAEGDVGPDYTAA
ncbi:uncharacterized protein LOC111087306 [Limulus polyphemus]|uniref:Uncharacterized protein LOC111087306 n=1 Tax=Limulus polyphemus TaxID=6850 RepID=A0ABM1T014_LIMPO|nr:uncharacterized protein LOC111087306 [Limulus polyphemus]